MNKEDLKSIWQDAHHTYRESNFSNVIVEKSISLKHSKIISKTLLDVKLKAFGYSLILFIYAGLMIYALIYLGLILSAYSLVSLGLVGVFLLINTTSEFVRFLILTKTADNMSVKESLMVFRRKLNRIKTGDFISYLIFFYLLAILILFNYLKDIGGVKNLSRGNEVLPLPLLGILILILLAVPWFIKYQHNQYYKKLYSNLEASARHLEDPAGSL